MNWLDIETQLKVFLKDEVANRSMKNVTVGLSGGLDSAVVAILCKKVFGDNLSVVLMPSKFSSKSSIDDAIELCEKFEIKYEIVNITPMIEAYFNPNNNADNLRIGNYSARVRMSVLYDISARDSSLVIGTSNKSELLLGYGTIFGDIACAINPIGELYKSDEFDFARYLGVCDSIIEKKPSADLWDGQNDEDDLGYSYKTMDNVLKKLCDENMTESEILNDNIDKTLLSMVVSRMKNNAFKGELPTIAKINFTDKGN